MNDYRQDMLAISSRHISAFVRLQLFAQVATIGYENAALVSRINPEQHTNQMLKQYLDGQGSDFHDLCQMIALRCWSIVEAFVEDVSLLAIGAIDWSAPHERLLKIKCSLHEALGQSKADLPKFILMKISDGLDAPLKVGIARFESVLEVLGLGGSVDPVIKQEFYLLSRYRNCIMHNDGVIDQQFADAVPSYKSEIGKRLGVRLFEARRFLFACMWYAYEVRRRQAVRLGDAIRPEFSAQQNEYLNNVSKCGIPEEHLPFAKPRLELALSVVPGSQIVILGPSEEAGAPTDTAS